MLRFVPFILVITTLYSCGGHECKNTNPIFDNYKPTDQEYKAELVKQIQLSDPAKVHYWIDRYKEINKKPFMSVNVQGDGLCATMMIDLKNPNKLKHFKNVRGLSYSGAEIKGLQYYTDSSTGVYNFIFEEGKISD